jgi:hypothetical protein
MDDPSFMAVMNALAVLAAVFAAVIWRKDSRSNWRPSRTLA